MIKVDMDFLFVLFLLVSSCTDSPHEQDKINNYNEMDLSVDADMYDPFPNVDSSKMTEGQRMELCLSVDNEEDCHFLDAVKSVGCDFPKHPYNVCIVDGRCVVERLAPFCIYGYYYDESHLTPHVINYRLDDNGNVEAMYLTHTKKLYGWEMCDGPKEGAPEVCNCLTNPKENVLGTCP